MASAVGKTKIAAGHKTKAKYKIQLDKVLHFKSSNTGSPPYYKSDEGHLLGLSPWVLGRK